jgi:hypothetical protein
MVLWDDFVAVWSEIPVHGHAVVYSGLLRLHFPLGWGKNRFSAPHLARKEHLHPARPCF